MSKGSAVFGQYGALVNGREKADWYPSPANAAKMLLDHLPPCLRLGSRIVDAGAGNGALMRPLLEKGYDVLGYEIEDRGDLLGNKIKIKDWFSVISEEIQGVTDIIMNPPYADADAFLLHAMAITGPEVRIHALLRHTWPCAKKRRWARMHLAHTIVCGRLKMLPAGRVELDKGHNGTVDFSWFTFDRQDIYSNIIHVEDQ